MTLWFDSNDGTNSCVNRRLRHSDHRLPIYLDSSRTEADIDQNDVALMTGAPNGKPQISIVKEPFAGKVVNPRSKPRTGADIEREFNEKHLSIANR